MDRVRMMRWYQTGNCPPLDTPTVVLIKLELQVEMKNGEMTGQRC